MAGLRRGLFVSCGNRGGVVQCRSVDLRPCTRTNLAMRTA